MKMIYNEIVGYLIHLLDCGLKGVKPDEKPENVLFEDIFKLSYKHSVANLAFYSIEKLDNKPKEELFVKWKELRDKAIIKGITQLYERDVITEKLTAAGIDICPLKGCLIKEMYPSQDMRMMSDLDILMDSSKSKEVGKILLLMGYKRQYENEDGHDVYKKKPVMNVEMHNQLVDINIPEKEILEYYSDAWKRLVAEKDNKHLYRMNWNDFYIFFMAHLAKHYNGTGTGIRSIMDIHVFLQQHEQDLDRAYIKAELEKMQLVSLWEDCEKLATVWFGNAEPDEQFDEMTEYIVKSGTYGAIENRIDKEMVDFKGTKFKYYVRRLFPPKEKMYLRYSILKKYPFLQPVCWIHRIVILCITPSKRRNMKREMEYVNKEKR